MNPINKFKDSRSSVETHRLPHMSHPRAQNTAPTNKPMFSAKDRNSLWNWNSLTTGLKMRPPISWWMA